MSRRKKPYETVTVGAQWAFIRDIAYYLTPGSLKVHYRIGIGSTYKQTQPRQASPCSVSLLVGFSVASCRRLVLALVNNLKKRLHTKQLRAMAARGVQETALAQRCAFRMNEGVIRYLETSSARGFRLHDTYNQTFSRQDSPQHIPMSTFH